MLTVVKLTLELTVAAFIIATFVPEQSLGAMAGLSLFGALKLALIYSIVFGYLPLSLTLAALWGVLPRSWRGGFSATLLGMTLLVLLIGFVLSGSPAPFAPLVAAMAVTACLVIAVYRVVFPFCSDP